MEKLLRRKAELKLKKVRLRPNYIFWYQFEPFLGFGDLKKNKTLNIQILMDSNFPHSTHSYFKQRDGLTQSKITETPILRREVTLEKTTLPYNNCYH